MAARILIVDDEQLMTAMLSALLKTEGYDVVQASDGLKATAVLAEITPDVILCDLAMPGMDGFELLQWVRQNPRLRHIPFAVITAHGDVENRVEALQLGADDFVLKPFSTSELVAKVNGLVEKVKQARELSRAEEPDLAGDLAEVSLPDVFHILELSHKTGRINLSNGPHHGAVYFKDGQPVHAEGEGWVGDDALLRFFTWEAGHFEFSAQETTEERSTTSTTHQILVEGVKFLDSLENAWRQTVKSAVARDEAPAFLERHAKDLAERDLRLFKEVDGQSALADMASRAHLDRFEAFVSLRTLISCGLVQGRAEEEQDPLRLLIDLGEQATADRARVLIIDSFAPYRQALVAAVNSCSSLQVVGAVGSAEEALALIHDRDPSVLTLDLNLQGERGLSALKRLMVQQPRPIVVVSALTQEGSMTAFDCLRYGAVDFMPKQSNINIDTLHAQQAEFVERIQRAASIRVENIKRIRGPRAAEATRFREGLGAGMLVAVGSGVGGVGALIRLVAGLPEGLAAPVLVIQHLAESTLDAFVTYLQRFAGIPVRRAENNAPLKPGFCHIACSDHYVNIEPGKGGNLPILRVGPRPALFQSTQTINWAFFSVAETFARNAVSVILAGQSEDGSNGAAEIRRTGGGCIVQDPETSIAPDMPRAAIGLGVAEKVVPDGTIGAALLELLDARTAAPAQTGQPQESA